MENDYEYIVQYINTKNTVSYTRIYTHNICLYIYIYSNPIFLILNILYYKKIYNCFKSERYPPKIENTKSLLSGGTGVTAFF